MASTLGFFLGMSFSRIGFVLNQLHKLLVAQGPDAVNHLEVVVEGLAARMVKLVDGDKTRATAIAELREPQALPILLLAMFAQVPPADGDKVVIDIGWQGVPHRRRLPLQRTYAGHSGRLMSHI